MWFEMQEMPVPQWNQAVRSIGSKHQTGTTEEANRTIPLARRKLQDRESINH